MNHLTIETLREHFNPQRADGVKLLGFTYLTPADYIANLPDTWESVSMGPDARFTFSKDGVRGSVVFHNLQTEAHYEWESDDNCNEPQLHEKLTADSRDLLITELNRTLLALEKHQA